MANKPTIWQRRCTFALDPSMQDEPTLFKLVFMLDETMYSYFLAIRNGCVIEEYLALLTADQEELYFERTVDGTEFGSAWDNDILLTEIVKTLSEKGTLAGRIAKILSNNEKYTEINSVYHFLERIFWVSPNSTIPSIFPGFYDSGSLNTILGALDTGVTGLDFTPLTTQEQPFDQEELDSSTSIDMQIGEFRTKNGKLYAISHDDHSEKGNPEVKYVRFRHRGSQDHEYLLDWRQESQGTRKIIMLLPWLWAAARQTNSRILLVDKLDNSLHTQLAKALIQGFLRTCTNRTRTQLIFTTHDLLLMDCNELLRRDEIWITDKSIDGESTLIGLPEYRGIMHDEDIRKSYLEGRFGGTPQLDSFTLEK
nr:AAA family ATPase [uncultured Corynebacterium sp.]